MKRIRISRLKNKLRIFLRMVQAGDDARYRRHVAVGIIRPGKKTSKRAAIRPVDMGPNPGVLEALLEERREGR